MRQWFCLFLTISFLVAMPAAEGNCGQNVTPPLQDTVQEAARLISKFRPTVIAGTIYYGSHSAEAERELFEIASASPEARSAVIDALVDTLNEPELGMNYDAYSSLSSGVCRVLGKLKAVEAVDVLVKHLGESSMMGGFSYTSYVSALVQIGEPAVPRIQDRLSGEQKCWVDCRINAIRALAGIRGDAMKEQFELSLVTETDPSVRAWLIRCLDGWDRGSSK